MSTQDRVNALIAEAEALKEVAALEDELLAHKERLAGDPGAADDPEYRDVKNRLREARSRHRPAGTTVGGDAVQEG